MLPPTTVPMTARALVLLTALAAAAAAQQPAVSVERSGSVVTLSNRLVAVRYDLAHGTWDAIDRTAGRPRIRNAVTTLNAFHSDAPGAIRTAAEQDRKSAV